MIDIGHKVCEYEDCIIRPNYDVKGGKGRMCASHKLPNMVDIANKTCEVDNCIIRARYGRPGYAITRCTSHREKGMIAFSHAICKQCKQPALWGKNMHLLHCEDHKQDDDINMVEQPCISCHLTYTLDKNNYCEHCNPESFARAILSKQNSLMNYLDSHNLHGTSTDRCIDNAACGKERPDRILELDDKIIILECDEHQHKDRACVCEQTRMINIGQSFGGIPVYFIRFNPDNYTPLHKTSQCISLPHRYQLCRDFIKNIIDCSIILPNALVSCIYLLFDGWNGLENEKWHLLSEIVHH